jgi:hypothetical protein
MEPGHRASSDFFESDGRSRRATQCDVRDGLIGDRSRGTDVPHGGRRDAHNDWAHFRYHGCGSHCSAIWLRMFCRVRRSTSRTSRCFVRGSSLKDSIRQYRFPVTSLVARKNELREFVLRVRRLDRADEAASAVDVAQLVFAPLLFGCEQALHFPELFEQRVFDEFKTIEWHLGAPRSGFLERVRPQSPSAVVRLRRPTRANRS